MNTRKEKDTGLDELLSTADAQLRAEVFVHSLAPVGSKQSQDQLLDRLNRLMDNGPLSDIGLEVWGDSICTEGALSKVGAGERIVDTIGEFYALAATRNISIAPFFRISNVQSSMTDESFRRIVPPSRCVALYDDNEDLVGVFPSLIDGVAYTPEDIVEYLETQLGTQTEQPLAEEST